MLCRNRLCGAWIESRDCLAYFTMGKTVRRHFTIRAFRIGIDAMRDVRAREESRMDFKMFGLSHWQKELYLLK